MGKKPEERLEDEPELMEAYQRLITDNIDEILIYQDLNRQIKWINKQGTKKLKPKFLKEIMGKKCHEIFHGKQSPCEMCQINPVIKKKKPQSEFIESCLENLHVKIFTVFDQDSDKIQGIFQILKIVPEKEQIEKSQTEKEQTEKYRTALQQNQKLESLAVLIEGIGNDFNNHIMTILGNAELGLMYDNLDPQVKEFFQNIKKSAQQAANVSRQLLVYAGQTPFKLEHLDLNKVIRSMFSLLNVSICHKTTLRMDLSPNLPKIYGDKIQIGQILLNLVNNASEALEGGYGVVSISTGIQYCNNDYFSTTYIHRDIKEGDYVYLEVSDTGCGIPRKDLTKIFDPFYTTKIKGQGLGLSAVLGVINTLKGTIKVYSEVGKGTTFKVLLPIGNQDLNKIKPSETEVESRRRDRHEKKGTIMVIDDQPHLLRTAKLMLERLGYEALTYETGREALEAYEEKKDDIMTILLDLSMPGMDGKEVFRRLRLINPDVKVILSSGYAERDVMFEFSGKRLVGFLQKPYLSKDLENMIQKAIRERKLNQK